MPQNVPVFEFLQTADANWNSLGTLPDWRQVRGSLCCNKDFEKPWARDSLTHIIMDQVLYILKC